MAQQIIRGNASLKGNIVLSRDGGRVIGTFSMALEGKAAMELAKTAQTEFDVLFRGRQLIFGKPETAAPLGKKTAKRASKKEKVKPAAAVK